MISKVSALLAAAQLPGMAWGSAAANGAADTSMKNGELECDVHDLHGGIRSTAADGFYLLSMLNTILTCHMFGPDCS